jgi:hypothetical protein
LSLRSFQDVDKYKQALEKSPLIESIVRDVEDIARALEEYWEKVAIPLGRLEGLVESYMRSREFGVVAKYVGKYTDEFEERFRDFIDLRKEYSKLSHEFMRQVVYDDGYGLYFIARVVGVNLGRIQDIARKTKSSVSTLELFEEIVDVIEALDKIEIDLLAKIQSAITSINIILTTEGLDPVWDESKIDSIVESMIRVGADIQVVLARNIEDAVSALRIAIEVESIDPGDMEYYDDFERIVERFGGWRLR